MKKIFLSITALLLTYLGISQGCVAIRSNGSSCSLAKPGQDDGWTFSSNNRYFKSYKHFVGTDEQHHRVEAGTEVINHSFSWDLSVTRIFNKYWSLNAGFPLLSNVRSSLYEHEGNSAGPSGRHETKSFGIGDARVTLYRWLLDPARSHKGNVQVGLGLKLPTGDYEVEDFFIKNDSTRLMGPVDQSIQLGDGGTGLITEVNAYYNLSSLLGVYGTFYYLINPREQNGVSTSRGGTTSATNIKYFTSTMSVPDQFMIRAGANYMFNRFHFSGGVRIEGIPSSDLIGGDKGFRRPGYVISAEPVITYQAKRFNVYASVPVALERSRTQSYADKLRSADTGNKIQGDAAFADYSINLGFTVRL